MTQKNDRSDHMMENGKPSSSTDNQTVGVEKRETWSNSFEFILSCLGYAVGLGNIWRFPYICLHNGGGAFLIPYVIMLLFVGVPVFLLELLMGQFSGSGPATIWVMAPLFQGIGYAMVIITVMASIFYTVVISWGLYYLFASFQAELPWGTCTHEFNTPYCYSNSEAKPCEDANGTWFNQTCYNRTLDTACTDPGGGCQLYPANITSKYVRSTVEFFNLGVLQKSATMDEHDGLIWQNSLLLLLTWLLSFLCVMKGVKSTGKVVYFTALFPYLVMFIFLIRGVTLPGAWEGIKYYIIPTWGELSKPQVWSDAAGQIFFSLSIGMGGLMTFSSYNSFNNNVFRDALIVSIGNCLTSFFAGFVIFSILGYMANELGVHVDQVIEPGPGLIFIAYPQVLTRLPVPQLWSILFFLMVLTLGLDSQFAGVETVVTAVVDVLPRVRKYKTWVALGLCAAMYLLGLNMCTGAGVYWVELMSHYATAWSLLVIGAAETLVIAWAYGAGRVVKDAELMLGFRLWMPWKIMWAVISPIIIAACLVWTLIYFKPLKVEGYTLPQWAQILGWAMACCPILVVLLMAVVNTFRSRKWPECQDLDSCSRVARLCKPLDAWPSEGRGEAATVDQEEPDVSDKITSVGSINPTFTPDLNGHTKF